MVPRQIRETFRPVEPRLTYSIAPPVPEIDYALRRISACMDTLPIEISLDGTTIKA